MRLPNRGDCGPIQTIDRRSFLRLGLGVLVGAALPWPAWARLPDFAVPERTLSFFNIHTGENLKRAVYWAEGEYIPQTLAEFNYLLRDHRADEVKAIDPRLFDLLFALRKKLQVRETFHVISGYRSPATNAALRRHSSGVAKHSLHMDGKAADICLPGVELATLRRTAMRLKAGGVGYYPKDGFVHVDTGRVRYW